MNMPLWKAQLLISLVGLITGFLFFFFFFCQSIFLLLLLLFVIFVIFVIFVTISFIITTWVFLPFPHLLHFCLFSIKR